ncbi:MAG TPA: hypothetical protein DDZ53_10775 [Firmicutes bacterium]|nr:hypothetical protein [Bacillota bacterium]
MIKWVQKRDGRIVPFHAEKIADAIFAAAKAVGGEDRRQAEVLAGQVIHLLQQTVLAQEVPQVEDIQDLVEKVLIEQGHARTAKAFILYRNQRTRIREAKSELMDAVSEIFQEVGSDTEMVSTPLGKLQRIAIAASERYSLNNLLPREFALAHQRRRIYIDRLAHYATSVAAVSIDLRPLLKSAQLVGRIRVPMLQDIDDLEQAVQASVVAAQSETVEEVLLANIDQVFAELCRGQQINPSQAETEHFAIRLLKNINLALTGGSVQPFRVCLSIGSELASTGQCLSRALLMVAKQGLDTLAAPQIVFNLQEGVNLQPEDAGYTVAQLALQVAQERGNPRLVHLPETSDSSVYFLASGVRLERAAPVLLARTFVNVPRLALEATSEKDFLANIDAVLSLVAKQMVHRSEILTPLQPLDLPLAAAQLCQESASSSTPWLRKALLLVVPLGIREALQVARHRFGEALSVTDCEFVNLLYEICEHWRNYYSLNLQLGIAPSLIVARRFFAYDAGAFPLVENLWPGSRAYSCMLGPGAFMSLPGGRLDIWPQLDSVQEGVVYIVQHDRPICWNCGQCVEPEGLNCPVCQQPLEEDGHLVL